jgi:flagellar biogenesis protein FliO
MPRNWACNDDYTFFNLRALTQWLFISIRLYSVLALVLVAFFQVYRFDGK